MMFNEFIFFTHAALISFAAAIGSSLGKEALVALICIQTILSNIFVSKQIVLFGLASTCSDAFSVGSSLCLNLLQEKFGQQMAKRAIWTSLFTLIFYLVMSQIHLWYIPSASDYMQEYYQILFNQMPRITIASLTAYFISQQTDRALYAFVNNKLKWQNFILKNYSSLLISQLIDTILFSFLGLYGMVDNIWQIITLSYMVKVATITFITPLTKSVMFLVKRT